MEIIAKGHVRSNHIGSGLPLGVHHDIRNIAGVRSIWILQAMLFSVWIEMPARRFEVRSVTFCILMDVNSMLSRREIVEIQADLNAVRRIGKGSGADAFALPILKVNCDWFWGLTVLGNGRSGKKHRYAGQEQ